jgi:hypothetical protein
MKELWIGTLARRPSGGVADPYEPTVQTATLRDLRERPWNWRQHLNNFLTANRMPVSGLPIS